ncbi:hypothetical protein KKA00_13465, partial [bacterium]|nr:hypothetical protein [bacterium]
MRFLYRILLISVLVIASSKQANSLKIVHFAVGKGDATLIISPTNQTLMIDAGSETYGGAEAADRIYSYMAEHCIEYLTYTIITHSHDDHLNAFPVLFEDYNILPIIAFDRGAPGIDTLWYNCSSYHHYIDLVESYAIRDSITAGHVIDLGGGVTVTAIYSNGNFSNGRSDYLRDIHSMENVRSMCLLLEYENFRYVIAGDITGKGGVYSDKETPSAGIIGDVDVFQVNHHGGGSSTNQNWLDLLRPEAGVLSADSLMAKQDVLDRIDACPSMISLYHTGLSYNSGVKSKMVNGNVILETDGLTFYKIVSDTFAIAEESPLSVSIYPDPDYVVIPAEGGSFDCLLEISNSGTEELQFDCWTRWHHDGNWRTGSGPADLT